MVKEGLDYLGIFIKMYTIQIVYIQLTLEQHEFELAGSPACKIFLKNYLSRKITEKFASMLEKPHINHMCRNTEKLRKC